MNIPAIDHVSVETDDEQEAKMDKSAGVCRSCGSQALETVLSYGRGPLAELLIKEEDLEKPEPLFPLDIMFCSQCALVQIAETVDPSILYTDDYVYYSSVSRALVEHFASSAEQIMKRRSLNEESLVVEAASNDGYMLKLFVEHGIPVLGIDPAKGPAEVAQNAGVPTLCRLFDCQLATELRDQGRLGGCASREQRI